MDGELDPTTNARFLFAERGGIDAAQVPNLKVEVGLWLADGGRSTQPADQSSGGRVFLGSDAGNDLFAGRGERAAFTGRFQTDGAMRVSPSIAAVKAWLDQVRKILRGPKSEHVWP